MALALMLSAGVSVAPRAQAAESTTTSPATTRATPSANPPGTGKPAPKPEDVTTVESFSIGPGGSLDPSKPGNRVNFTYDAAPGTVIHDTAIVYNFGNVPLPFRVYATDGLNLKDGSLTLLPGDKVPSDVGSWVSFDAQDITIPPLKQALIPITIKVPAAARPGDHVGGVVASSPVDAKNDTGQVITVDRRVGSKMYLRVNGKFHPELAITRLTTDYSYSLSPTDGRAKISFRVENRGDVRLGGIPVVKVSGPLGFGERSIKLPALKDLLPGGTADLSADIPKVGSWFTVHTTVQLTPEGTTDLGTLKASQGSDTSFTPPITVLVVLAVATIVALLWSRARKRRLEDEALLADVDAPEGDYANSVGP
jgi:hypothetical protein